MHVAKIRTVKGDRVYESFLIRRSYREDGKVKHENIANITHLPAPVIELIRAGLRGEPVGLVSETFEIVASHHHGHVQAVLTAMKRLGMPELLSSRGCRERDVVLAMVVARILAPDSKLAHTRWWPTTTLPAELGLGEVMVSECYNALDWLIERQDRIEAKLAKRHLTENGLSLYDLSSSYFEGLTCPLATPGYSRDRKRGKLQVNYGLLTAEGGQPVAITLVPGNTRDSATLVDQAVWIRDNFKLARFVLVGDRGMFGQDQIDTLRGMEGVFWVAALKHPQIRKLVETRALVLSRFKGATCFELASPAYPGERLVACRNPAMAEKEAQTRNDLLASTLADLAKVATQVASGRIKGQVAIGVRVGRVVNRFKVAKFVRFDIHDDRLAYWIDREAVKAEAALDGIYVIRTNVPDDQADAARCVRIYKRLARVERAFRAMKTVDLHVRPIRHFLEDRVRAHFFLAMLAYYVEWHLREVWAPLLFDDENTPEAADPVVPANRSKAAWAKAEKKTLPDGTAVQSFQTLLQSLATVVRNTCRCPGAPSLATFSLHTTPTEQQERALRLLEGIKM
jgi:hypothetical protein